LRLEGHAARADDPSVEPTPIRSETEAVRVSEVLAALSFALDLAESQPMGHALRTCLIGMRIAERLDLGLGSRRDLYYALLLKDMGGSSRSAGVFALFGGDDREAMHGLRRVDPTRRFGVARVAMALDAPGRSWLARARRAAALVGRGPSAAQDLAEARSIHGGELVERMGLGARVAAAVRALDERWDGSGRPDGLVSGQVPMLARVVAVAQALESNATAGGAALALQVVRARSGRWFDPTVVEASRGMEPFLTEACALGGRALHEAVAEAEPGGAALIAGPGTLDRIAQGFADAVDAKSPFTAEHSRRVTAQALRIARHLGFERAALDDLRRAALLHDIGKLSLPNAILDKPGPLTADEWDAVRMHPYYTQRVLEHVRGFERLARIAGAHHERLDGHGYHRGLRATALLPESRVLAVADVYDALTSERPYRPALPDPVALRLMEKDRGTGLCPEAFDALVDLLERDAEADGGEAAGAARAA
jgi:HD-GYP domain-containing protein (c-di-GMP phosphodiesterase class II)